MVFVKGFLDSWIEVAWIEVAGYSHKGIVKKENVLLRVTFHSFYFLELLSIFQITINGFR